MNRGKSRQGRPVFRDRRGRERGVPEATADLRATRTNGTHQGGLIPWKNLYKQVEN
jgi:hypothetical protein